MQSIHKISKNYAAIHFEAAGKGSLQVYDIQSCFSDKSNFAFSSPFSYNYLPDKPRQLPIFDEDGNKLYLIGDGLL